METIKIRFAERGYSKKIVNLACERIMSVTRSNTLKTPVKELTKEEPIRFITTYSNKSWQVRKCLKKCWHVLNTDVILKKYVGGNPSVTFRKCIALKDLLCSCAVPKDNVVKKIEGFYVCGSCKACKNSTNCKEMKLSHSQRPFHISKHLSCKSDYCVYASKCPCSLVYIGSTIHQVKKRILEHLRAIVNEDKNYPVARHFKDCHTWTVVCYNSVQ